MSVPIPLIPTLLIVPLCFAFHAGAQEEQAGTVLTVYPNSQPALAFVRMKRSVELGAGENRVEFPALRAIDPSSVMVTGEGVWLAESTLSLPPATPELMLKSYVGRDVLVNRKQGGEGDRARQPETLSGKLLSFDKDSLVLSTPNRQIPVQILPRSADIMEIKLLNRDDAPPATPLLACVLMAATPGKRDVDVSFKTAGFWWTADYALVIPKVGEGGTLTGHATISNESGGTLGPTRVTLAYKPPPGTRVPGGASGGTTPHPSQPTDPGYRFSFPIPRVIDLPAEERRRASLFEPRAGVSTRKALVFFTRERDPAAGAPSTDNNLFGNLEGKEPVDEYLFIDGAEGAPFDRTMPAGGIRVVQRSGGDPSETELVAEGEVGQTPPGKEMMLRLGTATGLNVTRKRTVEITERAAAADAPGLTRRRLERVDIVLNNRTREPRRVYLIERMADARGRIAVEGGPVEMRDAETGVVAMDVPPRGSKAAQLVVQYDE